MKLSLLILLQVALLAACSSPSTKRAVPASPVVTETKPAAKPKTAAPAPIVVTKVEVVRPPENLNLRQLDSAATALRAIYDRSLENSSPMEPTVIACDISGEDAMAMMMPLKGRMDEKIPRELKDYNLRPKAYSKEYQLAECEKTCHCGLYATLLTDAVVESTEETWHKAQLKKIRKKASAQTPEETLACARLQSWFCESALQEELRNEI